MAGATIPPWRNLARSLGRARRRPRPPDQGRPEGSAGAHHQHPARDAGGRRGRLPRVAGRRRPEPAVVAGHSLGEYSALVAPGVLTLSHAAPLVRFRAQAMQDAVPVGTGAMAAVLGMDAGRWSPGAPKRSAAFGANSLEIVEAVNFNDPMQTVIAGSKAAVDKACELLKANGAKRALLLPVSAPFHSSLMKPAAEALREKLASQVAPRRASRGQQHRGQGRDRRRSHPRRPGTSRPSGRCAGSTACAPSRLRGVGLVECGPGKVLPAWCKRIDPQLEAAPCTTRRRSRTPDNRRGERAAGMSDPQMKGKSPWSPAPRAASARPSRVNWPARRSRSWAPATTDEGAAKIRRGPQPLGGQGIRTGRQRRGGRGGPDRRHRQAARRPAGAGEQRRHHPRHARHALKDDDWDAVLDTNLKAVFRCSAAR
jgi:[acyl-carrier-protein] S-malonyltransferase